MADIDQIHRPDREDFENLPDAMRRAKRWLVWRLESKPGKEKPLKVPYWVTGGKRRGQQNSPEDWANLATFEDAWAVYETGRYDGLGFACGPDGTGNAWQAIDLDKLTTENQHLQPLADDLPGFTDESPSGTGRHAYGYGREFPNLTTNGSGIEAFGRTQFVTVTCVRAGVGDIVCLAEFVERVLKPLHTRNDVAPAIARPASHSISGTGYLGPQRIEDLRAALAHIDPNPYAQWIAVGQALHSTEAPEAFMLWDEWSRRADNYDGSTAAKWRTFHADGALHVESIFTWARDAGWDGSSDKVTASAVVGLVETSFRWGDDMTASGNLRPSQWVIRKVLPAECTGLLYGGWGTCKSFTAIDMAGCIANGMDWHGRPTQAGTVFYLAGEGEGGFARRLAAWQAGNQASTARIAFREMPEIRDPKHLAETVRQIEALAAERGTPRLIVLDTLFTALNGGEENSGRDMGEVFRAMKLMRQRFGCAVLAVHHTGHDGDRARGHSSMPAGVDVQFYIKAKMVNGVHALELTNPKQKDGKEHAPIFLTTEAVAIPGLLDDEGEQESSLVIRAPAEDMVAAMRAERDKGEDLDALRAEARRLRSEGMTLEQIGLAVGRDKGTVSRWLKD